jgi:flagellar biosynthesis protein FliR
MNGGYLLVVGISFGILLILSQRIVPRHKRMFRGFIVTMAIFLMIRYEYQLETLLGYVLALFLSFLFWLLIGRYNPVNDKDEIKVYGLND